MAWTLFSIDMEELFAKWIREALAEKERAQKNQNTLKAWQMRIIAEELRDLRDKLVLSMT